MSLDNTFYAFIALIIFVAILIYLESHKKVAAMLDARSAKIAKDLSDAKRLREEAEALLREYQQKRNDADKEAQEIIDQARREAVSYTAETKQKLTELVERRRKQAEQKIAQAEATAIKEVRAQATDTAIAAASQLIAEQLKPDKASGLVADSISALKNRLN